MALRICMPWFNSRRSTDARTADCSIYPIQIHHNNTIVIYRLHAPPPTPNRTSKKMEYSANGVNSRSTADHPEEDNNPQTMHTLKHLTAEVRTKLSQ
ncbi:C4 protein [Corchorus yellow vein virus - [Hoa Binh]]|uniref:AC4 n=2 Tax=Corchorus yellow vein virus TaxID=333361 RepID=A0A1B1NX86_9GEMI|nr:C4 protein [Corchorus yellow vein virus - [Hoa Binh]]AAU29407.1 C4 protein [Corchorus yellow vein virus - [Hoa Binh]]AND99826.1 AC4 [Corchorus yellow vein Vietnam virus [CN:FZ:2015]]ANS88317.1 AC4 [Corchorus yellow vein virus - [Hoa Binh]]